VVKMKKEMLIILIISLFLLSPFIVYYIIIMINEICEAYTELLETIDHVQALLEKNKK